MWPTTVLSLFFPCSNLCAENFVIYFYEIKLLFTYLLVCLLYLSERTKEFKEFYSYLLHTGHHIICLGIFSTASNYILACHIRRRLSCTCCWRLKRSSALDRFAISVKVTQPASKDSYLPPLEFNELL